MTRNLSNVIVFLAATMLPLRLPMGECRGSVLPAQSVGEQSGHHHHHDGHHHSSGHGHHHGQGHDRHDERADKAEYPTGSTTSAPNEDDHHPGSPCACAPEDLPATLTEVVGAPQKPSSHFGEVETADIRTMGSYEDAIAAKPPPDAASGNLLSLFRGNPCALLSRWVI